MKYEIKEGTQIEAFFEHKSLNLNWRVEGPITNCYPHFGKTDGWSVHSIFDNGEPIFFAASSTLAQVFQLEMIETIDGCYLDKGDLLETPFGIYEVINVDYHKCINTLRRLTAR